MNSEEIKKLLIDIKLGNLGIDEVIERLSDLLYKDLGYAKVDNHRELRVGYPEVIYCAGKTLEQIKGIVEFMMKKGVNILGTRALEEAFLVVKETRVMINI